MKKRPFKQSEGVSNIELFYDLIFVYCISVITSLCHHVRGDFLDPGTWLIFMFSFLVILQIWLYSTMLMNRFGDRSAIDNICLFTNMFLLFFMANGIRADWENSIFSFNLPWALILFNLAACWIIKSRIYDNLDETDLYIMHSTAAILIIQGVLALAAAFLSYTISIVLSWITFFVGFDTWLHTGTYRAKPVNFSHIAERCALLVILTFGETIVTISDVGDASYGIAFSALVFAVVVGLFLIYIYEHDRMLDHHATTNGLGYMSITAWLVVVLGNLTVALEYMPMERIAAVPKNAFLTASLVLYLLTSFLLGRYNKPEFTRSTPYIAGRLGVCAFIVVIGLATGFDSIINLVCHAFAIYFALWHEWMLFHRRNELMSFGRSLGISDEDLKEAGLDYETREGRRALAEAIREAQEELQKEAHDGKH